MSVTRSTVALNASLHSFMFSQLVIFIDPDLALPFATATSHKEKENAAVLSVSSLLILLQQLKIMIIL